MTDYLTNGPDGRDGLAPYEGQRVHVTGYFTRSGIGVHLHEKTACVEDVICITADGNEIQFSHTWVQRAHSIPDSGAKRNDKVAFAAFVVSYRKGARKCYGLRSPEDVEVEQSPDNEFGDGYGHAPIASFLRPVYERLPPPSSLTPPVAPPPVPPVNVLATIRSVKELLRTVNADSVRNYLQHRDAIDAVLLEAGDADQLAELLDLLA